MKKKEQKNYFTSSVAVYGFAEPGTDETGAIRPFNEYGRTKFDAEEKLRDWQLKAENSLISVRPTVIFWEFNRGNVFNLINLIASGKFVMIGKASAAKAMKCASLSLPSGAGAALPGTRASCSFACR